jgi:hypothetical protein
VQELVQALTAAHIVSTLSLLGWWLLATALVNLVAHKSQVDSWCEKRPKLAAVLKLFRAVGFDPWLLVQSLSLFVKGKLPEKLRNSLPILIVACSLTATGCAGSFEVARSYRLPRDDVAQVDELRCRAIDEQRIAWGAVAKGSAFLAGGSGVTAFPVEDDQARFALAATAIAAGAASITAVYVSEQKAELWVRECAR